MTSGDSMAPPDVVTLGGVTSILSKWIYVVVGGAVLIMALAFVAASRDRPQFEASVAMLVAPSKVAAPEGFVGNILQVTPDTFASMIGGRAMTGRVLQQFGLDKPPHGYTAESLQNAIVVAPRRGTSLVTITVTMPDPGLAVAIARFVAAQAVELNAGLSRGDAVATRSALARQRDQARRTLETAQATLLDFERSANLDALRAEHKALLTERERLTTRAAVISTEEVGARAQIRQLVSSLLQQERLLTLSKSVYSDPAMATAIQDQARPGSPPLAGLRLDSQEVNELHQKLQLQLTTTEVALVSLADQRQDVEAKIRVVARGLVELGARIADAEARHRTLTREHTLTQTAYAFFAKRADEAELAVAAHTTEINPVDAEGVIAVPSPARRGLKVLAAGGVSVAMLCALAITVETARARRRRGGHAA